MPAAASFIAPRFDVGDGDTLTVLGESQVGVGILGTVVAFAEQGKDRRTGPSARLLIERRGVNPQPSQEEADWHFAKISLESLFG